MLIDLGDMIKISIHKLKNNSIFPLQLRDIRPLGWRRRVIYCFVGWGIPVFIAAVAAGFGHDEYWTENLWVNPFWILSFLGCGRVTCFKPLPDQCSSCFGMCYTNSISFSQPVGKIQPFYTFHYTTLHGKKLKDWLDLYFRTELILGSIAWKAPLSPESSYQNMDGLCMTPTFEIFFFFSKNEERLRTLVTFSRGSYCGC